MENIRTATLYSWRPGLARCVLSGWSPAGESVALDRGAKRSATPLSEASQKTDRLDEGVPAAAEKALIEQRFGGLEANPQTFMPWEGSQGPSAGSIQGVRLGGPPSRVTSAETALSADRQSHQSRPG
jgi:hypothetical protein